MFGRKARRIAELEDLLGLAEDRICERDTEIVQVLEQQGRTVKQLRDMRAKIVRQRMALREQTKALATDRKLSREAADLARLALAKMTSDYEPASVHDGNHPLETCEACRAYVALEPFATKPWHAVIRRRALTPR